MMNAPPQSGFVQRQVGQISPPPSRRVSLPHEQRVQSLIGRPWASSRNAQRLDPGQAVPLYELANPSQQDPKRFHHVAVPIRVDDRSVEPLKPSGPSSPDYCSVVSPLPVPIPRRLLEQQQ